MPPRLDHVTLVAADFERLVAFLDRVLGAAGMERVVAHQDFEDEDEVGEEAVGYGVGEQAVLWVVAGRVPTRGLHVALRVDSADVVDAVASAVEVTARHRELDRPGYYGVTVTDPEGNAIEFFSAAG